MKNCRFLYLTFTHSIVDICTLKKRQAMPKKRILKTHLQTRFWCDVVKQKYSFHAEVKEIPFPNPIFEEIHQHLIDGSSNNNNINNNNNNILSNVSRYYFDGQGKSVRPKLTETMSEAVNSHLGLDVKSW